MSNQVEEAIRAHIHPSLERDLMLNSFGTIGAGKSTFLTAVHQLLGYSSIGVRIKRGRQRWHKSGYYLHSQGINRSNATVYGVDQMPVFCYTPKGFVVMQFHAPGSHHRASKTEVSEDVGIYFLDLMLSEHARMILAAKKKVDFFPLEKSEGMKVYEYWDTSTPPKEDPYGMFKNDQLGLLVESLLDAQERLEEKYRGNIPVIGLQTYSKEKQSNVVDPASNATIAEQRYNALLRRYFTYLKKHGFPRYFTEGPEVNKILSGIFRRASIDDHIKGALKHNDGVKEVKFSGLIREWYLVDSCSPERDGAKEGIYAIAAAALKQRGIETQDLKLVRFIKRFQDDPLTIHYDAINL